MRLSIALLVPIALAGCAMSKVTVDSSRLAYTPPPNVRLACAYRLGELVDARPVGGSGVAAGKAFELNGAIDVVRTQLAASGLAAEGTGREVDVRLMQMYIAQNTITLVPVVVYEATVEGGAPVVVRGQPASINDWGTEDETIRAYGAALRAANDKLVRTLNQGCPATTAGA